MKNKFYLFISLVNKIWLTHIKGHNVTGFFFSVNILVDRKNSVAIKDSELFKTKILVAGSQNHLECSRTHISNSLIKITGNNNTIVVGKEVKLRNVDIVIRGNSCRVDIGDRTTFGGVRMINVGENNSISIGEDCLFSDKIEIWASDTHAIYDSKGQWVNKERPITIGNKVWVGSGVTILKGVSVGDGSIIGIRSTVTKDIPSQVVGVGSPCKVVKEGVSWSLEYPKND